MANTPLGVSGRTAMEIARQVSIEAGEVLMRRFHEVKQVSLKGEGDIVTDVDKEAEALILGTLRREFPDMGFLGEESLGARADKGFVWIVDPVDGTRNYAWGIPFFSLVVGLALDGEVLLGINYDPWRQEMFHAERGKGAFLNDRAIHVSERTELAGCILGVDLSYSSPEGTQNSLDIVKKLWGSIYSARVMGSSALGISYAAAGRADLYFHHGLSPWDQVAGMLLVEEAGGVITDRTGRRAGLYSDGLVASSRPLHAEFMRRTDGMPWRQPAQRMA